MGKSTTKKAPKEHKEEKSNNKGVSPKAIEDVLALIRKDHGVDSIMRMGESPRNIEATSSGCLSLDMALGVMGYPKGRIIELFGPESSGKTTVALHAVAQVQKAGGIAAFIDAEHALNPQWAQMIGVDINSLLISQPMSGEESLNICSKLADTGAVAMVVVDSVAALVPQNELDGEIGDVNVGLQARMMSQAMRRIAAKAGKSGTTVIFINQIREKIGVTWGSNETTPGGRALKFYSSVRIDVRRIGQIKEGQAIVGARTRAKIAKNKVAPPFKIAEFDITYKEGISTWADLVDLGVAYGVIQKAGSWFNIGETRLGQGKPAASQYLASNPELTESIRATVIQKYATENPTSVKVSSEDDYDPEQDAPPEE